MGYWENRQAQMMYEYMEDAERLSQELADIYAKASRHLSYEIQNIYEKFRDKHGLTDAEAKRLLNTLRDKNDIAEMIRLLDADPKNAALVAKLESGAYRARIERLEQLQLEVDRMMQQVFEQEKKITTAHYADLASNSYYRQIYNVQRQVGFQFSFAAVDPKVVALVLGSKWSGANYSKRIWKNTQGLANDVKEQLLLGLLTGKREGEMAKEISNKFATGAYEARRLVRTESAFVNGQMQLSAYEECDAEQYDFVATLDLKTSEICRELDGKVFYVQDAKPGVNMNPMHPFCRSTTTIHLGEDVLAGLKRRARNPETGKNELVPANMNYKKWYEQNVANNPKAQAAEKMIKNRRSDTKQYEKYKEVIGSNAGKTLAAFQEMKYNNTEAWADMVGYYKYKKKYPDSSKKYYDIMRDLEKEGISQGVVLPAKAKHAYILPEGKRDPNHIMKRMLERNITDDELRGYVDNAKVMFVQWGGRRQMFVTPEGVAVIAKSGDDWVMKTGWKKEDFDEDTLKILEVMRKYGKSK